jgi:predicted ATP-dependent serine protease
MSRAATITITNPYEPFGTFGGVTFWPGGLTLVAAEPGIGKTSWLLRMVREASIQGFDAVLGCYEHTDSELYYRARLQALAAVAGPHGEADVSQIENESARASRMVLLPLSEDVTIRALEKRLLEDYQFPDDKPTLIAVDYLNCIPVIGIGAALSREDRSGAAAAQLREMAKRHNWAIVAAAALDKSSFDKAFNLAALFGDERVPYRADRVFFMQRKEEKPRACGCIRLKVEVPKDRTAFVREYELDFWGSRFYPGLPDEFIKHD